MTQERYGRVKPADPNEVKRMEAEKKERIRKARQAQKERAERAKALAEQKKRSESRTLSGALSEALKGKELKRG